MLKIKDKLIRQILQLLFLPSYFLVYFLNFLKKNNLIIYNNTAETTTARRKYKRNLFIINNKKDYIQEFIYFYGFWEIKESLFIKKYLRPGDIFVDIGANIGWFTILGAKLIGNKGIVYAFEPQPKSHDLLQKNIKINKLNNVSLSTYAISNNEKKVKLYSPNKNNMGMSSIIDNRGQDYKIVETISFDKYFKKHINKKIRLVKIDTEGAEYYVISGMLNLIKNKQVECFLMEVCENKLNNIKKSMPNIIDILKNSGYKIFVLKKFLNFVYLKKLEKNIKFGNIIAKL